MTYRYVPSGSGISPLLPVRMSKYQETNCNSGHCGRHSRKLDLTIIYNNGCNHLSLCILCQRQSLLAEAIAICIFCYQAQPVPTLVRGQLTETGSPLSTTCVPGIKLRSLGSAVGIFTP